METSSNLDNISMKQIYRFLLEEITMVEEAVPGNIPLILKPLKAEL